MKTSPRLLVFDLDETLIRSREAILATFRELFAYCGVSFPEEVSGEFFTLSERALLERYFGRPELLARAAEFKADRYDPAASAARVQLYDGAVEVLDWCRDRGCTLAIATNRGASTDVVLAHHHIRDRFAAVYHAFNLERPKPDPLCIELICCDTGIPRGEAVMIGDSEIDVATARNAGIRCVTVWDHIPDPAGRGDYQAATLRDLPAVLENIEFLDP